MFNLLFRVHIREDGITKQNSAQQVHFGAIAATLYYASVLYGSNLGVNSQTETLLFHKNQQKNMKLIEHYRAVYNVGALAHRINLIGSRFELIRQVVYLKINRLRLNLVVYIVLGRYCHRLKQIIAHHKMI